MEFFDYMYYRVANAYLKWDGEKGTTAEIAVSLVQCVIMLDLIFVAALILGVADVKQESIRSFAWAGVALLLGLMTANHFRYKGKFQKLKDLYEQENRSRRVARGWVIILSIAVPLFLFVFLGVLNKPGS